MYRFGNCCSTGPATFGQDETGSEVAVEQGAATALGPMAPRRDHELPWAKLFGVSVLAGLTINYLTRRRG
jgi:hypothetical protein